jgi:hypothetical protein
VVRSLVIERVRERGGAVRLGAVFEQDARAVGALVLDRVVERVAELCCLVVDVRARSEQESDQLGASLDGRGGEQRRDGPPVVLEHRVRISAAVEQLARGLGRREGCVTHVRKRRPVPRPAEFVRVAVPAAAEHQCGPPVALDLGLGREQMFGALAPRRRGGENECGRRRLHCRDERRPAAVAVVAREHRLRTGELWRQVTEARERLRIARARRARELLGLLAELLEVHVDLLP